MILNDTEIKTQDHIQILLKLNYNNFSSRHQLVHQTPSIRQQKHENIIKFHKTAQNNSKLIF